MFCSSWREFLSQKLDLPGFHSIRTCDWVENLVHEGIIPELKRLQFATSVNPDILVNCILNYLYRMQWDHHKMRLITKFCCTHEAHHDSYDEEYEFFLQDGMPEATWAWLRHLYSIEWLADGEAFADRVWATLPRIVFAHINVDKSPAIGAFWDRVTPIDEEEEAYSAETTNSSAKRTTSDFD